MFKRRRLGLTNYRKRLALVKSNMYRLVVRKTNRRIIGQVVQYDPSGDRVLASADSNELKKLGWPSRANRATAYLTGMLLAKKFKQDEKELVLDIGLAASTKGSLPFVFAKGFSDMGKKLRGNFEIDEKLYSAGNVAAYAAMLAKEPEKLKRQFGEYIKAGVNPEKLEELFSEVKKKLAGDA
ncbi:MAG: 50S ribosomal protein L18 [Candidatus Micrarchaeia archaeon]